MTATQSDTSQKVASPRTSWELRYARRLAVTDLIVVVWAVSGAQIARFGFGTSALRAPLDERTVTINYTALSIGLVILWMVALAVFTTRAPRVVGIGTAEYRGIAVASFALFGAVAILAFLIQADLARSYVLLAFPIGTVALIVSRWIWRQWLIWMRLQGQFANAVVLLGSLETVTGIARELHRYRGAGYRVVGGLVPHYEGSGETLPGGAPIFRDERHTPEKMAELGADTLIVTSSDDLPPERIREISWRLEPGVQHLVVAPSLTDVGGPRLHMRPVVGLPLMHVETPTYGGSRGFVKRAFDLLGSLALIVVSSPILLAITIAIKIDDPGPVFFRQERVGIEGSRFFMLKFRSMVVDAEARLAALREQQGTEGNSVMFKMADDPRITKVGKFLRRYSLDEVPQFFNVFRGEMSLVGPRPPLQREVEEYEVNVHRRFLVKPGITGLWQVSGRSNLSWEDTVRLDLFYVENWSLVSDLVILWRTVRTVLAREGAY